MDIRPSASNMTIATASLSKLSPKMIVNNFGSTLYVLNIAITVTGSVAERVAPSWRAIGRDNADRDSSPIFVQSQTRSLNVNYQAQAEIPYYDSRNKCSCKSESQNTPNVSEEVCLH
jgi:hypothetical protein